MCRSRAAIMSSKPRREPGQEKAKDKAKAGTFPLPAPAVVVIEGVGPSLCDSCQRARWGCGRFDANLAVDRCLQYRGWTKASMQEAQRDAARGESGSADWSRLCRLIELEQRLCL